MSLEAVFCEDNHDDMDTSTLWRGIPRLFRHFVSPFAAALVGRADQPGVSQYPDDVEGVKAALLHLFQAVRPKADAHGEQGDPLDGLLCLGHGERLVCG